MGKLPVIFADPKTPVRTCLITSINKHRFSRFLIYGDRYFIYGKIYPLLLLVKRVILPYPPLRGTHVCVAPSTCRYVWALPSTLYGTIVTVVPSPHPQARARLRCTQTSHAAVHGGTFRLIISDWGCSLTRLGLQSRLGDQLFEIRLRYTGCDIQ